MPQNKDGLAEWFRGQLARKQFTPSLAARRLGISLFTICELLAGRLTWNHIKNIPNIRDPIETLFGKYVEPIESGIDQRNPLALPVPDNLDQVLDDILRDLEKAEPEGRSARVLTHKPSDIKCQPENHGGYIDSNCFKCGRPILIRDDSCTNCGRAVDNSH